MLSLTYVIRRLIISDKGQTADNASVLVDASWGVSSTKPWFLGTGFFSTMRWHLIYTYVQVFVKLRVWRVSKDRKEKTLWVKISFVLDWEGKRWLFSDRLTSKAKSRVLLAFVLETASCFAPIKLQKHPNHEAASVQIKFCLLCNSAHCSFKALS